MMERYALMSGSYIFSTSLISADLSTGLLDIRNRTLKLETSQRLFFRLLEIVKSPVSFKVVLNVNADKFNVFCRFIFLNKICERKQCLRDSATFRKRILVRIFILLWYYNFTLLSMLLAVILHFCQNY